MAGLDKNWEVLIRCVDCETQFVCENTDWSIGTLDGHRLVVIRIPQQCSQCVNLKIVDTLCLEPGCFEQRAPGLRICKKHRDENNDIPDPLEGA